MEEARELSSKNCGLIWGPGTGRAEGQGLKSTRVVVPFIMGRLLFFFPFVFFVVGPFCLSLESIKYNSHEIVLDIEPATFDGRQRIPRPATIDGTGGC